MTSPTALEQAGFRWEETSALPAFTEQIAQYLHTHSAGEIERLFQIFMSDCRALLHATGLQLIDYEKREVVLQPEAVRKATEFWNVLYPYLAIMRILPGRRIFIPTEITPGLFKMALWFT